jgi:hypothetical protein
MPAFFKGRDTSRTISSVHRTLGHCSTTAPRLKGRFGGQDALAAPGEARTAEKERPVGNWDDLDERGHCIKLSHSLS